MPTPGRTAGWAVRRSASPPRSRRRARPDRRARLPEIKSGRTARAPDFQPDLTNKEITMSAHRTAVITGATSERGIGIDVARRYPREGWAVVVLDLDAEKSAKVAADIGNQFGVPAFGFAADVTSEESVAAAHEAVAEEVAAGHLPAVGALANIAGITSPVPFLDTTLELWNKVMAVNATGTYLVTKAFLPDMIEQRWGRIVNMSSVSAQRGGGVFGKVPYSSAKAAVLGFTKALAR